MRHPTTLARAAALVTGAALTMALLSAPAGARDRPTPPGAEPCLPGSPAEPLCIAGTLADGTAYRFAVPKSWNGVVMVDLDGADRVGGALETRLLDRGYARGGTTRTVTGWDIRRAIDNQAEALQVFETAFGRARWAIATGASMGGFVSAGTAQVHARRFDAAVAFCGGLGGSVGQWNQKLDTVFTLKTLLFPTSSLPVTDIPADVAGARSAWINALADAQRTPQGRARIALAASIGQLPAWGTPPGAPTPPRPAPSDPAGLQEGMYLALSGGDLPYIGQAMGSRRQIEQLVGAGASWNTGVDYARQFTAARPELRTATRELYRQAGLSLDADLATLRGAPRIPANPAAVRAFEQGIVFTGDLRIPVLTVSNIGDQISTVAQQQSYEAVIRRSGNDTLLRQTYTESAGHCGFTVAEQEAALLSMMDRLRDGRWPNTSAQAMNARVAELSNAGDPTGRYLPYQPERFNRPYFGSGRR